MANGNSSSYTTGMEGTKRSEEICLKFPPNVISPGLAALLAQKDKHEKLMDYSGPRLHFQMVVIFVLTQIIHSRDILSPMVFSDEHSLVNISEESVAVLGTVGAFGFVFFLFLSGVKMDLSLTLKSGKKAICIGLLTVVVPLVSCMTTIKLLHEEGNEFSNKSFFLHSALYCNRGFVLRPAMKWMVKRTPEAGQIKDICFYLVILAFMMSPRWTPLGSALVEKLDPVISGLFLPICYNCGLRFDLSYFKNSNLFAYHQVLGAMVALIIKFGVSLLVPLLCKMPTRDSLALAFIMISKGIVERVISEDIFAHMTIVIILVASIVPILVKRLYDPSRKYLCFQKRTIMNSRLNQELRLIVCVHVPGNVNSIINQLNASCPTRESSIALDVLHLIKLSGQATPLFITHDKQKKKHSPANHTPRMSCCISDRFHSISPPNLMYEDICNLAMDRLTSFILLPFIGGDQTVRTLNFDILEKAPCSVGILVEGRRNLKGSGIRDPLSSDNSSFYNMLEALALAKRISQDKSVRLTVIHLKAANSLGVILTENDRMLDSAVLNDVKQSVCFTYIEEHVNDGPETSNFLQSIVEDYQLIIVGRRYKTEDPQTLGLQEWCEFQEIGIGDLLSSADFIRSYSLLIVQQQQQRTV
ncbi:hypothetical protein V6Z11_D13G100800 [Gossypium hirsutum]